MVPNYVLAFVESGEPIREFVTKFGGQPVWRERPAWPLSRQTGRQMQFVCQVAPAVGLALPVGSMAYLFMSDIPDDWELRMPSTWDPDAGENAVIVQPGEPPAVETVEQANGPSLFRYVTVPNQRLMTPVPCEYRVMLESGEDPDWVDREQEEETFEFSNKLGGTPQFLQGPELPYGPEGPLLLQLDGTNIPFYINLGTGGVAYLFLAPHGRAGKFLWQDS